MKTLFIAIFFLATQSFATEPAWVSGKFVCATSLTNVDGRIEVVQILADGAVLKYVDTVGSMPSVSNGGLILSYFLNKHCDQTQPPTGAWLMCCTQK